jgi:hypothetical protein
VGAQAYVTLAPQVVGELPTLPGLSGFVAGQALAYGMADGISPATIASRLQAPGIFSRAAISPWSDQNPATGTLMFQVFLPVFLTDNLIPAPSATDGGSPGEVYTGEFFANGDWQGLGHVFTPLPVNLGPINSVAPNTYLHPRGTAAQGLKVSPGVAAVAGQGAVLPQVGSAAAAGSKR